MGTELITAKLGFDSSEFTAGTQRAGREADALAVKGAGIGQSIEKPMLKAQEQLAKFGLAGVASFAAVGAYVKGVIDYAGNLTGELTANEQAAKNFSKSLDGIGNWSKAAGVEVLGFFNRVGELVGEAAVKSAKLYGLVDKQRVANIELAAETEKMMAKNAEWMDKNKAQYEAAHAAAAKANEALAKWQTDQLSTSEQLEIKLTAMRALETEMNGLAANSLQYQQDKSKLSELELDVLKLQKKQIEELVKGNKDLSEQREKDAKKQRDIAYEFYELEQDVKDTVKQQADEKAKLIGAEAAAINAAQLRGVEERRNLETLEAQTEEIERQARIEVSRHGTFGVTGNASSLSNYEINDQLNRLTSLKQEQEQAVHNGDNTAYFALQATRSVINILQSEVEKRKREREIAEKSKAYDEARYGINESADRISVHAKLIQQMNDNLAALRKMWQNEGLSPTPKG